MNNNNKKNAKDVIVVSAVNLRIVITFIVMFLIVAGVQNAFAFTAPTSSDMWYEFYNIFFTKLLQGPLGATLTGGCLLWGLISAIRGAAVSFVICTLTAGVLYNLDTIVTTFGLIA